MTQKPSYIKLKKTRTSLGLTQKQAAEMLDIKLRTYCAWEQGYRQPVKMVQEFVCKTFQNIKELKDYELR